MNKKHKHTGDINDKCHDLEKENLTLKEKENLLEREITKYLNLILNYKIEWLLN